MNEDAIDRKLVCAFIDGLISDDGEREKGLEYIRNMPPVNPQPCEDAISRQAVIDSLHSKFADGFDSDRWWNSMSVLYAINKVPPVNPTKTGWIPVSERLPENRKEVLVTDGTDIFTGWYEGDKWCSCYEEFWLYSDPIIAWMPLPKPYEPQERSDKE